LLLVGGFERGGERVAVRTFDQIDGAAAEATAGEAGSETAGERDSGINEEVDFFAAGGEVISIADVGLEHQLSEGDGISGEHRLAGGADTGIFGDDVAAADEGFVGHLVLALVELVKGGVAEVADAGEGGAQDGLAFFELSAADAVLAGGYGVFDHGVTDDDLSVGESPFVHGEMFVGEVAGVKEESVAGLGGGDDELVHDAAGRVDVFVFSALGEKGDLFNGERGAGEGEHGHGAGNFDGGGGAESGGEGNVAGQMEVKGWRLDAELLELAKDADGVVGPETAGGGAIFARERDGVGEELAGKAIEVVGARGDGGVGFEGDCHGQDEATGVIGMLTEQIDSCGGDAM